METKILQANLTEPALPVRVLAVDIGTNSTINLIAEVCGEDLIILERGLVPNRLGAEITPEGTIPPSVMEHNRRIVRGLVQNAKTWNCAACSAVGTFALRSARNRQDFIEMCFAEGMPVKVLSSAEEAQMAWQGVFGRVGPGRMAALLDLGGGSTELSYGTGPAAHWTESVGVGAVSLALKHFHNDPPMNTEVVAARADARQAVQVWASTFPRGIPLTCVGGTATALAALTYKTKTYRPGDLEGKTLTLNQVETWAKRLTTLRISYREQLPGMPPARAQFIHSGAVLLAEILSVLKQAVVTVSERGVMFALALELASQHRDARPATT